MAAEIIIVPGYTFTGVNDPLTTAKLNLMFSAGYGSLQVATIATAHVQDAAITAAKLATTLDLSSKTITLPADLSPKSGADKAALGTPDFVGQLGRTGAASPYDLYWAEATDDNDDWRLVTSDTFAFRNQSADPAGLADSVTLYTKEVSGIMQLFYMRGAGGTPVQLTGTTGTAILAEDSPDWDSGWTVAEPNTHYDLTAGAGGFSDVAKGSDITGETNASGVLDFSTYRLAKLHVKKIGTTGDPPRPYKDYISYIGYIPSNLDANAGGAVLTRQGGTWPVVGGFDKSVPDGGYVDTAAKLYLQTGRDVVWSWVRGNSGPLCDWDEYTNYYLASMLVRIQLWK